MDNIKIVVLRRFDRYMPGDVLAMPEHKANSLLKRGFARKAEGKDLAPKPGFQRAAPNKDRVIVKLKKRAFNFMPGDVAAFAGERARAMIADGVAELHDPEAKPEPKPKPKPRSAAKPKPAAK